MAQIHKDSRYDHAYPTPPIGKFYLAYRKVKAELWWAKNVPCREDLLAFERTPETLHENLFKLQQAVEEYRPEYGFFADFF